MLTLSRLPRLLRLSPGICEVWGDCQEIKTSLKCDSGSKIPSLVLFAHWEATSRLSDPDIHTISLLRQSGFQVIIVSTAISSTQGHDHFWETYAHLIDGLISRNNIGFDFGSWQAGLEVLNRNTITFDELILMNNSLYAITEDISTVIEKFKNKEDGKIRKHEHVLYMEDTTEILQQAQRAGFIIQGQIDLVHCQYEYQYLYILVKPS
jgi:hypothetical protein